LKTEPEAPVLHFDWTSQAFKRNPFPTLAKLREAGPLVRVRLAFFGKAWIATTYDSVNELLRDHHRFVQNPAAAGNRWMAGIMRWLPRSLRPVASNMLLRDPPDHRRLRSLVDQAFQRHSVEVLRPRLVTLADEALDRFARRAAGAPRGADLVEEFARPFPLSVICELLGLPPDDRPTFSRWASQLNAVATPWAVCSWCWGLSRMLRYVRAEIQRQSARPREGLLAALIQAEESGDRLNQDELVAMVFLLLAAGHHTTLHQIAASVLILLDHPEQLRELKADWSLAEGAVQELLRYLSFAQVSKPRYARADTEFCGRQILRGDLLLACLAAANSDPTVFPEPERFDIHRDAGRHVGFGAGIHFCLGAKLARAETEIALERLFTRYPDLQLAVPRDEIQFSPRFGIRGVVELPVRL
jgi:cytochrome P450